MYAKLKTTDPGAGHGVAGAGLGYVSIFKRMEPLAGGLPRRELKYSLGSDYGSRRLPAG